MENGFKTAEEVAQYLEYYSNSRMKEAAKFVRAQAEKINALERDEMLHAAAEAERELYENARAHTLFIQCGGIE